MFLIGEQPNIVKELVGINHDIKELAISGKTKNIELLGELKIKDLWIFTVNQTQFDKIMEYVNPEILYIDEMRVENLSKLQKMYNLGVFSQPRKGALRQNIPY